MRLNNAMGYIAPKNILAGRQHPPSCCFSGRDAANGCYPWPAMGVRWLRSNRGKGKG